MAIVCSTATDVPTYPPVHPHEADVLSDADGTSVAPGDCSDCKFSQLSPHSAQEKVSTHSSHGASSMHFLRMPHLPGSPNSVTPSFFCVLLQEKPRPIPRHGQGSRIQSLLAGRSPASAISLVRSSREARLSGDATPSTQRARPQNP
ncbi:hypothetical protein C8Q77DRAFT_191777 [Trametes polyzona]|nr:hypothetical protein C8Q77DRAFT_191777 [Trametes polyzona]